MRASERVRERTDAMSRDKTRRNETKRDERKLVKIVKEIGEKKVVQSLQVR